LPAKTVSADSGTMFSTLRNLWPYMWPAGRADLKARVLWASLFLVAAKLVLILVPYFFKWATNALDGGADAPGWLPAALVAPVMLVVAYNVVRVAQMGLNQLRDALFASVGQHAVRELARLTFVHLHRLSLRFHLERRTGGLSRIIERGVKGIETVVRYTILNTIPTILEFALTAAIFAVAYGLVYVAVIAVTIAAYVWFSVWATDWRIGIRQAMNDSDTDANTKAVDSLLNYETVKYFNNEAMETARFDRSMARYEDAATRNWTSLGWLNFGQGVILGVGMAICMAMSAVEVGRGTQTLGDFVFINAMLIQLSIPLNFIGASPPRPRRARAAPRASAATPAVRAGGPAGPAPGPPAGARGASRSGAARSPSPPNRRILKGVSFEVPAGGTVAIVGPSGAGKSTISRLLFRFYDVQSGRITIDGQDIAGVTQESLRAAIGMVPQDTVLFNDTIAYNIRYGRPGATDGEVREAAKLAQIAGFIEALPDGYATMVGERGLKLSGGEKQRVAIARTILKAPPILMLDEATSALDTHTEREIQAALDLVSRGRTTLVIAHRLSTVISDDEIIVLQDGRIAERGTHRALLAKGGLYRSMWDRQREATEAEERLRIAREADAEGVIVRRRTAEVQPGE